MGHQAGAGDPFEALGDPNRRAILRLLSRATSRSRRSPAGCRSAARRCPGTCAC